jgi:creatinine amidohydrolase
LTTPTFASVKWGELTGEELATAASRRSLVILPLGCTEQHGPHLPTDTDTYQVERFAVDGARTAAERYGVECVVLPALPFGPTAEHVGLVGAIDLPNDVYIPVIKSIVRSVLDNGFTRLGVVTGCGGHWVVPGALWDAKADARRQGRDMTLHLIGLYDDFASVQARHFPETTEGPGDHAAVMETALCLAGRAELVRRDRMRAPELDRFEERYKRGGEVFLFDEVTNTGALGDASAATKEGGEAAWSDLVSLFAERLKLIDALDGETARRREASGPQTR